MITVKQRFPLLGTCFILNNCKPDRQEIGQDMLKKLDHMIQMLIEATLQRKCTVW